MLAGPVLAKAEPLRPPLPYVEIAPGQGAHLGRGGVAWVSATLPSFTACLVKRPVYAAVHSSPRWQLSFLSYFVSPSIIFFKKLPGGK